MVRTVGGRFWPKAYLTPSSCAVTQVATDVASGVMVQNMAPRNAQPRFIAYYRVSTEGQGKSGLGLEAQREAVRRYLERNGWPPVAEFVEVESGKNGDRPELAKALAACRTRKATLIIAKLDRLARNVHFISSLMEAGVDFIAADNPHANRLTIHILAAVAEDEARRISERTKAALAAAKRRGKKLGGLRANSHRIGRIGRALSAQVRAKTAAEYATKVLADIERLGVRGQSYRSIAEALNAEGVETPRGAGVWSVVQVMRVLARADGGSLR